MKAPQKTRTARWQAAQGRRPRSRHADKQPAAEDAHTEATPAQPPACDRDAHDARHCPRAALESSVIECRNPPVAEVQSVASDLQRTLARIDSTEWRDSGHLVDTKSAEEIVKTFTEIRHIRQWRKAIRTEEDNRDRYRHDASGYPPGSAARVHMERLADDTDARLSIVRASRLYEQIQPTVTAIRSRLDRLTVYLVAILVHTTDLTPHYVLAHVVTDLLEAGIRHYPDCASRGAGDPRRRYDRIMEPRAHIAGWAQSPRELIHRSDPLLQADGTWTTVPAVQETPGDALLVFRAHLFDGDPRFPQSLFRPHRSKRKVEPRLPH